MKTNILICVISLLLAVCSMSCSNHSTERVKFTDIDKSSQDLKTNSTDEDSCLLPKVRLSEFAKYQSFDEFSMSGIGDPNKQPFVYIKESKDSILLVASYDTAQVYVYQYGERINRWVSYKEYDMDKKDIGVLKEENVHPARSFLRICGNDTIIEYECDYIFDLVVKYLFIKTPHKCIRISLLSSDFEDKKDLTQSILLFVRRYNADKSIIDEGTGKYRYQKRYVNEYTFSEDGDSFRYKCNDIDDELVFPKTSLGYFGTQPGFDKCE